jgi:hypothetical protein
MSTSPVTFVSLAAELQQRFALAAGEVQVIDRLQIPQYVASGAFAPWPLGELLRALHAALEALDVRDFEQASRSWEKVQGLVAQIAPFAEQAATPVRRLALDLALHTGAIGNVGKDLEPLLQMLGQLLLERDKMLKHAEAQAHVRTLFGQAAEFAKRANLLQEIATSGRTIRASLTALLDAQKAVLATVQGPMSDPWPAWHKLVTHFAETMRERPALARHHPAVPETQKRLVALVTKAINEAEEAEALRRRAKDQLLALQRHVTLVKTWVIAPWPSAPNS